MNILKRLFAHKATKLGIGVAFVFQVVFFTVWLTAYDGVEERVDQFTVAVIHDNESMDESFMKALQLKAPFTFEFDKTLEAAKENLDQRKINMVMQIPDQFFNEIHEGKKSKIEYYINQSTPSLEKQMMETAASTITKEINAEVYALVEKQGEEAIPQLVSEQFPENDDMKLVASLVVEEVLEIMDVEMVDEVIHKEHDVDGFTATMIPLMVVLASYIGAMILSQQMELASRESFVHDNKLMVFFSRQVINVGVSFILSIITLGIMLVFGVELTSSLIQVWLFQSVLFLCFLSISQFFVILFGNPGMVFNIILTATQLVSSGAIVPRELLPNFYETLGTFLPATYGVNGYFSVIYGGGDLMNDFIQLLLMIIVLWAMALLVVGIVHFRNKRKQIQTL